MEDTEKTREEVYDERIAPLMAQIVETCKANDIPIVASFQLEEGEEALMCSTVAVPAWANTFMKGLGFVIADDIEC